MIDNEIKQIGEEIAEKAFDLATTEIILQEKSSADEVKQAAKELIAYSLEIEKLYNQNQQNLKKLQGSQSNVYNNALTFNKKMVETQEQYKTLMSKVFNLQNKINSYLGQPVQMIFTYISKNGEVELFRMDNSVEHLKIGRSSKSHGGALSGRYSFNKKQLAEMERITNSKYNPQSLDTTFKEVYERYKKSKTTIKTSSSFYILWKINSEWHKAEISSVGVLGETYAAFYLAQYLFQGMMETRVGDFIMNDKYGAIKVDNVSGFLQGDISLGNTQIGIKAKNASALGYMEILKYAKEIIYAPDLYSYLTNDFDGLKKRLSEKGKVTLAKKISDKTDEEFKDLIKELEKNLT